MMAYETRASKIFGGMDTEGLTKDEIIAKAMKEHNLKKITAVNYYYEWNRANKIDELKQEKAVGDEEAVEKILGIISENTHPEQDAEATEDVNTDTTIKVKETGFRLKTVHFSGENGEYYIDDTFMLSNPEGSLTFENKNQWESFKAEIDAAFDYVKNMEVLIHE